MNAEVVAHSVGPNGAEIVTVLAEFPRFLLEMLKDHKEFSITEIAEDSVRDQVAKDPALPVLWPKQHKDMQGTEVFGKGESEEGWDDLTTIQEIWKDASIKALNIADNLSARGLSKQLTNRLLEPWVNTKCVITSTEWDNFFMLRHPWYSSAGKIGGGPLHEEPFITWESEVNLNFPAEYNVQALAIEIKKAIDASEPDQLEEGEWHLPFIGPLDREYVHDWKDHDGIQGEDVLIDISAARSARTSYGKHLGKTVEDDLDLAKMLRESNHWSPFEHQAQAIGIDLMECNKVGFGKLELNVNKFPQGLEVRINSNGEGTLWSRNFQCWIQGRSLLDVN